MWQSVDMGETFRKIKEADSDQVAAELFIKGILPKQVFPF